MYKFKLEDAIKYAESVNNWRVWQALVSRTDLPIETAMKYAESVNDSDVWKALFNSKNV